VRERIRVETSVQERSNGERRVPVRTCVGCGRRDDAAAMVRLVVAEGEVAFDLAGGSFGRGAHLHARPACVAAAPRGLGRAFHRDPGVDATELGRRLVQACDRRMAGMLLAARRMRVLAVGADAAIDALTRGAPLAIVAVDAGGIAASSEVRRAVADGRAMAWKTRQELGALLGAKEVALCALGHPGIAARVRELRVAADAGGAATTREGAICSQSPEAR